MIETINIKTRSNLIVAKQSKRTYFTVTDDQDRKFLCFNQSAFNEMPVGAGVAVEITERGDQTPTIDLITETAEKKPPKKALERAIRTFDNSQRSFACSYAKDVVVALIAQGRFAKATPEQLATATINIANRYNAWLISSSEIAEQIEAEATQRAEESSAE